jgi:hypothetical protein
MGLTRFEHDNLRSKLRLQAFPHRPQSSRGPLPAAIREVANHRIECRDYSACDASAKQEQRASQMQDYSDKPPSNWTSQSPGIQLYGPIT